MIKLILPFLIIVAAIAGFFKFTDPQFTEIDNLRAEQATLNSALSNARKLHEVEASLREKFNAIPQTDIEALNKMVPDNVDNVRLIIDIDNVASKYGMKLRSLQVKTDEEKPADAVTRDKNHAQLASVVLGFSVTGPYGNYKSFLADLSHSLRLADIAAVTFSSNEKGIYDYAIQIQTYWLK